MSDRPLTALQEKACRLLVEGNTQADAYRKAGYSTKNSDKTIHEEACRLFAEPKVSARVKQLRDVAAERSICTVASLTMEYNEAKEKAYELEQIPAAIQAINGKARIHGHDKVVHDGELTVVKIVDLTGKKVEESDKDE